MRRQYDPSGAAQLAAHVTLVFAQKIPAQNLLHHLQQVAENTPPLRLTFRRIVVGTDHAAETGYAFLVPDDGNAALYALRDALHTGPLAGRDAPHIPFVPHVTVGRFPTPEAAARACADINATLPEMRAPLSHLTLVAQNNSGKVTVEATIALGR